MLAVLFPFLSTIRTPPPVHLGFFDDGICTSLSFSENKSSSWGSVSRGILFAEDCMLAFWGEFPVTAGGESSAAEQDMM